MLTDQRFCRREGSVRKAKSQVPLQTASAEFVRTY
jgi:hypothetical protein